MPSKELVISQNRHETKVAILEDGQLVEMFFQRANEYSLAGSIHKGRVTRVLPGMQSAFVDLGLERDCFLYVSDFFEEHADEFDRVDDRGRESRGRDRDRGHDPRDASPVLALPPVGGPIGGIERLGDKNEIEFAPVSAVPNVEAGTNIPSKDVTPPAIAPAAGPADASTDPNRDRRGRRSRRRRRGSRGFPDAKYASPTEESAEPAEAEAEGEMDGSRDATVLLSLQATTPPVDEFLLLPGESLAKYRRVAQPAPPQATRAHIQPAIVEPAAEDDAQAEDAAEAILDRVDEMEELAEAAAAQQTESDEAALESSEPDEVETEVQAEAPAQSEAKHEPAQPEVEIVSASLVAELPVSELKADKPARTSASKAAKGHAKEPVKEPEPVEEPEAASVAAVGQEPAPTAVDSSQAAAVEVSPFTEATEGAIAEGDEAESEATDADSPNPEMDLEADQESDQEADQDPEKGAATALPDGEDPAASGRTQGGRMGHRMSRRMRRKSRQQPATQTGVSPEAAPVVGAELEAPLIDAAAAEPDRTMDRTMDRPDRNNRGRDNRGGRDRERGNDRGNERENARGNDRDKEREGDNDRERPTLPLISDLLKEGQEIIVQIAKEPLGQKGARITSHIALPGRYVVYMPTVEHLGVSRKIGSDDERMRLKKILQKHRDGIAGGFIMRTAGEGRTEEEIAADIQYLATLWLDIKQKAEKRRAPLLLHHDVEVVQRLLRDQLTEGFKAVWVDNEDLYEQVLHAMERLAPQMLARVKLYTRPEPIFDAFGITQELEKALRPKVWLKSGGYIVINQTEALVAIDVNTGKYVGKSNRLEDTIVKTNVEAVKEIVRQMRLRDLGGIIVVDFIDMDERKNRTKVMTALEEAMRTDKAPYKILQFNDFGLVAITRKRVKQSLERALCSHCPYCEGAGYVKSVPTVISEILIEAQKYSKVVDGKECVLRASPEVAKEMKSIENKYLEEIEETLGRPVLVVADELLHQEKFDLT